MNEQVDLDICWHSTFSRPVGYAMVSRTMALVLEELGVKVSYEYLYGPGTVFPVAEDEVLDDDRLNTFKRRTPGRDTPHLIYGQADAFEYVKRGILHPRYRIGFSMLETTGLPGYWVSQFNKVDEVWTPTAFNVWTFRRWGVTNPICVMPLGVDVNHFNSDKEGYPPKDRFTFLSIFEWGERKAPEVLLKAFNQVFRREEPVVLICKFDNWDGDVDVIRQMDAMELDPNGGQIVFMENQYIHYEQLPQLYRSADCFVFPTRGEGWGMPILEAMACGLPVIATYWSAQQTFLTDANSYPVQVSRLIDAKAKCPYYEGFKWAETDAGHLKSLLRHVYENPEEGRAKGRQGARDVREKWSLELCGKRIRERLEEIARERSSGRKPPFVNRPQGMQPRKKIGLDISRGVGGEMAEAGRASVALAKALAAFPEDSNPFDYLLLPGFGDFVNPRYLEDYSFDGVSDRRFTLYRGPLPAFGSPDHYVPGLDLVHGTSYVRPGPVGVSLVMVVYDPAVVSPQQDGARADTSPSEADIRAAVDAGCHFVVAWESARAGLAERYGLDADRVSVVPVPVDPAEFNRVPAELQRKTLDKHRLPEGFFFCVGTVVPESLGTITEAARLYGGPEPLVIAGAVGPGLAAGAEGNARGVRFLDNVAPEELPALYSAALATVYPPVEGGFGLPVLESMACGTPVIALNTPAAREAAGDACLLVDDQRDAASVAEAMASVASDEAVRRRLVEQGLHRASRFSPQIAAASAVGVYAKLVGAATQGLERSHAG